MTALLSPTTVTALEAAPFTYSAVGATSAAVPEGFHSVTSRRQLARRDFHTAAEELLGWQVQERAGLSVAASSRRVAPGAVVKMTLGIWPVKIQAPCRVVYVIEEVDRAGFAYGTLPGHPETGEELFLLEQRDDGSLTFTIAAFSSPASFLARAGGAVTRRVQAVMTNRYLAALDG